MARLRIVKETMTRIERVMSKVKIEDIAKSRQNWDRERFVLIEVVFSHFVNLARSGLCRDSNITLNTMKCKYLSNSGNHHSRNGCHKNTRVQPLKLTLVEVPNTYPLSQVTQRIILSQSTV
ncbi:unnamed protein product [Leptosia nina]|uniref:Uncharacterized protein n=1 Tax=Leptosia nina TaxID=320188 RepID=A0AAV1JA02_9NEOP